MRPAFVLALALASASVAVAQTPAGPAKKPTPDKSKYIVLDRKAGTHVISAKVGQTLRFDITTGINASTGYHWIGPDLDGKIFGRVETEYVRVKNYEKVKKEWESKAPMPGAPGPHLEDGEVKIKLKKAGTGTVTFRLGRTTSDGKPQDGDTICIYQVTVK